MFRFRRLDLDFSIWPAMLVYYDVMIHSDQDLSLFLALYPMWLMRSVQLLTFQWMKSSWTFRNRWSSVGIVRRKNFDDSFLSRFIPLCFSCIWPVWLITPLLTFQWMKSSCFWCISTETCPSLFQLNFTWLIDQM